MKIYKAKNYNGFTLIEILITLGLITIIGTLVSFVSINTFRGNAFRSEVSVIGTALQTARANSFNNINQKKHGVAFNQPGVTGYVIFEGNDYVTRDSMKDINLESSYEVDFDITSPTEITFDQLSGNANYSGEIKIIDPTRGMSVVISINHEGKISW